VFNRQLLLAGMAILCSPLKHLLNWRDANPTAEARPALPWVAK
jgi:hypothetical protein